MNIVVCIKQTPVAADARLDPVTKTLVREGVNLTISSLDRRALLESLRLRQEAGGTVTVITMGPPQARSALVECLALGADRVVHLVDQAFAGADTLATARTLAQAIAKLAPDLVVCGKFTIDSETAQVPGEMAEFLDMPQVTSARKITPVAGNAALWVEQETDEGYERYEVTLPAVLSITELVITGRRPTPEELEAANDKEVVTWTAADLGGDPLGYGQAGSPTRVVELRSAELERSGVLVTTEDPKEAAEKLRDYMVANGLFRPRTSQVKLKPRPTLPSSAGPRKAVWVYVELVSGKPRPVTYELLGAAHDLASGLRGEVAAVMIGGPDVQTLIPELASHGADAVYVLHGDAYASYDTERYTGVLASAVRLYDPHIFLLPSTTQGRDLAPRLAARLQVGLTGDCVGFELEPSGEIAQIKPAFGGNIVSPIYSRTRPVMATVRPGMLAPLMADRSVQAKVVALAGGPAGSGKVKLLERFVDPDLGATKLDDARTVIVAGMGVGDPKNVAALQELVEVTEGALAATLRVATAGWLPPQLQIGLTGKAVAPQFFMAIGVSGQPNHLVGAKKAQHIIAINTDPDAPIFKSANFGIVGDWAKVVPELTATLKAARLSQIRD